MNSNLNNIFNKCLLEKIKDKTPQKNIKKNNVKNVIIKI